MGVKSNTTPGGVGFNEWRFDDTKGKEQVFIHAEKDMDLRVKNDRRELVIHDTPPDRRLRKRTAKRSATSGRWSTRTGTRRSTATTSSR